MPRPKGSKNRPRNLDELLAMAQEMAQQQGKELTYSLNEAQKAEPEPQDDGGFVLETPRKPGPPPNDKTEYLCGACGAKLDGQAAICPQCGVGLKWE